MVVPALPAAGMEMVVRRLTEGLSGRGHDVGVTCLHSLGPVADDLRRAGHAVTLVPTRGVRTIFLPRGLTRWFHDRRPDVLHIHSGAWLKAVRAATRARVARTVFTMHGFDGRLPWYDPLLDRWAARRTGTVVAVTEALVPYLTGRTGISPDKVRVVPNGIDVWRFAPGPRSGVLRRRFGLDDDDIVIGHVARFSPVKNHSMLVDAFALVLEREGRAFLALIGDGPLRETIEARVERLGIGRRVGFLGHVTDPPTMYRELDLLVLPSFSEAASMSVLEGMASGLPIVATAVGGTPALLAHGDAGVLVPSDDAASLATALIRLAGLPEERARLGRAARDRAVSRYGEEAMLDAYERLYADPAAA